MLMLRTLRWRSRLGVLVPLENIYLQSKRWFDGFWLKHSPLSPVQSRNLDLLQRRRLACRLVIDDGLLVAQLMFMVYRLS